MRAHLNPEYQVIYDRYVKIAIHGGCDAEQAQSIAKERTLLRVMKASADIANIRERMAGNTGRDLPL